MADDAKQLTIPADTRKQFPQLIELILGSESMNDEERQYWINVLPTMKPAQRTSLEEILTNEKKQLAAIEQKYGKKLTDMEQKESLQEYGEKRTTKRVQRKTEEIKAEEQETQSEEEILGMIEEN